MLHSAYCLGRPFCPSCCRGSWPWWPSWSPPARWAWTWSPCPRCARRKSGLRASGGRTGSRLLLHENFFCCFYIHQYSEFSTRTCISWSNCLSSFSTLGWRLLQQSHHVQIQIPWWSENVTVSLLYVTKKRTQNENPTCIIASASVWSWVPT